MKLSKLLSQRQALLRQAHLANIAFAYRTLGDFAARAARAGLRGRFNLRHVDLQAERYWPSLTALDAHASVVEEHFTEEDILKLADVLAFTSCQDNLDVTFTLDELSEKFLPPLRVELEEAGVAVENDPQTIEEARES